MIPLPFPVPWRLVIALGAFLAAFGAGWTVNGWQCSARAEKALQAAYEAKDRAVEQANAVAADYEALRAVMDKTTVINRDKVKVIYANRSVAVDCALPVDALGLLDDARGVANAAATGEPVSPMP